MNSLLESIDPQIVLVVGAIAVSLLIVRLLLRVLDGGLGTILTIVAIVLVLQYGFGIGPKQLWFKVNHLPQDIVQFARSFS